MGGCRCCCPQRNVAELIDCGAVLCVCSPRTPHLSACGSRRFTLIVQLKEQLSQSHDKDSDLPTPLMFAAASSSLDSRSLNPLLSELLGCMCDIDEARRQRYGTVRCGAVSRGVLHASSKLQRGYDNEAFCTLLPNHNEVTITTPSVVE